MKKKRGPASALEKAWDLDNRRHLDALLARAFYSGGISFNFARNPYFREAISFACSHDLQAVSFGVGALSIDEATTTAVANEGHGDEET
jgi:hypothetical protein